MAFDSDVAQLSIPINYAQRWRDAIGHEASRTVLRDAAHEMIRTRGLEQFNMRALATRVGLSPMATYRYYGSKDILIEEIRKDVTQNFAICLKAAAATDIDPITQFRRMCSAYIDFAIRHEQDYVLMFGSVASRAAPNRVSPDSATSWRVLIDTLRRINHGASDDEVQDQAHLIWATLHGIVMLQISRRLVLGRSIEQLSPGVEAYLLRALGIKPA